MCGRFTLRARPEQLAEAFDLTELPPLTSRYNIAPSQGVLVVRRCPQPEAAVLRWGLIPSWADDPAIGYRMINARAETLASKPSFRQAYRRRRCLVLADGFYEWQHAGRRKQPYFVALAGDRPFAFAGLWESWQRDDQRIESCALITTTANALMAPIHDRMPVILAPADYDLWLDPLNEDGLDPLLRPYPAAEMTARPITTWVNDPKHEDARCLDLAG